MKELYKRINLILANWNPLSIPKNIAEVEYLHYIPIIISLCNSKKKLESYLIKISLEMGLPRNKRLLKEISRIVNDIIKESLEQKKKSAAMSDLNRLVYASGKVKQASYSMQMTFGRMSEPLTKVQKVDSTKTAQSYDFTYKYEDSNHPTAPTQIEHEHYTYDANGNLTLVENDSLNTERRMYWDEDNRLMVLSDNGKTCRYTYNAAGERIIKSHGDLEGVYINGAPQGITFHETEDYTIYPAPIITVTKNRFTKCYFIGNKRVASKLGVGKFSNGYGISGNNVTAGQKDYAARMMQIEKQREEYYKSLGTPPGVPTMKGATADPDNTGRGYNDIIGDLGDHSVPEGWVQRPKFNEKGDVPGPPIQWQKPEDPDNAQPGYGYVPADTTNTEEIFFYHSDHLGSTSYITDAKANITQFDAYLPYGELLVDEHTSSEEMPYKFNGKQFDEETGLYYYGARYLNPMASVWYGVDPLAEKYMNLSAFIYCHGNPIRFIDFDGRWFWEKDGNLHAEKNDNTKTMADFLGTTQKNALEILHRNKIRIGKGGKIKVKDLSKLTLNKNSLYVMKADKSGVVLEDKIGPAVMMGPYAESSASSPNSNSRAILHYYFGHGEAADVGDHATEQLMSTSVYQDNVKVVTTQRRTVADFTVDMTSRVFHIGRTPVSYKVYPGERTSIAIFTLYANKHGKPDSFSDPLDINREVGGTPYNYKPRTVTYFFKPIGK